MYTNIFDTHAHYADHAFDEDRDALLASLPERGVSRILLASSTVEDMRENLALAERFPHIRTSAGVHPECVERLPADWLAQVRETAKHEKVRAIGEIGLDYHYEGYDAALQRQVFEAQLALAGELGLPVIVHIRDAMGDALEILRRFRPRGVVHCFSGSAESAREVLGLGMYIGFTGVLTFKNARKPLEALTEVPVDRLLLETDCPYMAPVPFRGKRCDSSMIAHTAQKAAEIKGMDTQALIDACCEAGRQLFGVE